MTGPTPDIDMMQADHSRKMIDALACAALREMDLETGLSKPASTYTITANTFREDVQKVVYGLESDQTITQTEAQTLTGLRPLLANVVSIEDRLAAPVETAA